MRGAREGGEGDRPWAGPGRRSGRLPGASRGCLRARRGRFFSEPSRAEPNRAEPNRTEPSRRARPSRARQPGGSEAKTGNRGPSPAPAPGS
ncbi:hypothetical protein FS847_30295 [Streptomyces sp. ISID311]|nr:hypothetical protein FS847_30295 [Streptomyces sp. ISID311]